MDVQSSTTSRAALPGSGSNSVMGTLARRSPILTSAVSVPCSQLIPCGMSPSRMLVSFPSSEKKLMSYSLMSALH